MFLPLRFSGGIFDQVFKVNINSIRILSFESEWNKEFMGAKVGIVGDSYIHEDLHFLKK